MAYWVGHTWNDGSAADWHSWVWLNEFFGGVAGLVTGSNGGENVPASARLAALALLVCFVVVWRRAMLARSAYKPGPVDVQALQNATGEAATPPLADLTAQFRKQLSETSLYPPPGVPEAPAGSVLDLVGDIDPAPEHFGASMMRFLASLRPKIAYRVKGELQVRTQEPCCGMTVTVTSYALGGCRMTTVWQPNWEETVRSAVYWVVASILPVTRAGKRVPWRDWVGRDLPPDLFAAFQKASQLTDDRKYDEAMDWFFKALRLDPLNPYIRHRLSVVQQACGLYIDALDVIQGSLISDGQREDGYKQRLWESFGHLRRPSYLLHLRRRPDAIDVRYDYANLLRLYDDLPNQWCNRHGTGTRAKTREKIRQRLIPVLADRYWPFAIEVMNSKRRWRLGEVDKGARTRIEIILRSGSIEEVRLLFQRACAQEMYRLASDRPLAYLVPGVRPYRTWTDLRIVRDLLAPLDLSRAWGQCSEKSGRDSSAVMLPQFNWHRKPYQQAASLQSLSVSDLNKRVRVHLYWPRWPLRMEWPVRTESRQWQDHYNAACVYAVAMRDNRHMRGKPNKRVRNDLLAEFAVDELRKALRTSDSAYTTVKTKKHMWLIDRDPDLTALRQHRAFKHFVGQMYPHKKGRRTLPLDVVRSQMATYEEKFLAAEAHAMEQIWHQRGKQPSVDVHSAVEWFRSEERVWISMQEIAETQAGDWPTRVDLIEKVKDASNTEGVARGDLLPGVPSSEELDDIPESINAPQDIRGLLKNLRTDLNGNNSAATKSRKWLDRLRDADASGTSELPPRELEKICRGYAAAWQTLGDWFESPTERKVQRSFESALEQIPRPRQL
ncbi:hypothetical protein [Streptomyces sp. NBC_01481]|uniref:hypothetical protein n=1 Tax=Streptomyces sp. NBC_01481 TaxID=2975869 RepID=UPI002254D0EB|nr:hypothetical protein [Streptomyces sp. NBC_01481]MCX4588122.1 hypothetical protein [Streptomyces sp. NBC_01481]